MVDQGTVTEPRECPVLWSLPVIARQLGRAPRDLSSRLGARNTAKAPFPAPDIQIQRILGWRPERLPDFEGWFADEKPPGGRRGPFVIYHGVRDWALQTDRRPDTTRQWWHRYGLPAVSLSDPAGGPATSAVLQHPAETAVDDAARAYPLPDVLLILQPNPHVGYPMMPGWLPDRRDELAEFARYLSAT